MGRPVLSLQAKLDQIAREREALSVLQTLARLGLREGDRVANLASGESGRISIRRNDDPIVAVVETAGGATEVFDATQWRPTGRSGSKGPTKS